MIPAAGAPGTAGSGFRVAREAADDVAGRLASFAEECDPPLTWADRDRLQALAEDVARQRAAENAWALNVRVHHAQAGALLTTADLLREAGHSEAADLVEREGHCYTAWALNPDQPPPAEPPDLDEMRGEIARRRPALLAALAALQGHAR